MAKIVELQIRNFRGIKNFYEKFNSNTCCFVGRGDTCKTTILEAISYVLSPSWNLSFYDTDFYDCCVDEPIEITVSLINIPENLLHENKYGLHVRFLNPENNEITDDIIDESEKVLTIKLKVDRNLEPNWSVVNLRQQEDRPISATDRAKFNCFLISDYIDRHFTWNKGTPLYTLLNFEDNTPEHENPDNVLDALREAKRKIDNCEFQKLATITENVCKKTGALGLNIANIKSTIDFKDLYLKENRVSLHENKTPLRLKGKGSKRLISIAIQSAIANQHGIMLIDELEQGLEPDRIRLLVRSLKNEFSGQLFLTTHSREVITELSSVDIRIIHKDGTNIKIASLDYNDEKLQKTIRACSEAFFAKKVIVCEGKTEIGICKSLDIYRKKNNKTLMSFNDCAYVDGEGSNFAERAKEIVNAGFDVAILCDSDCDINPSKSDLLNLHVAIFDCEEKKSIEEQVFTDLPWDGVKKALEYVKLMHDKDDSALKAAIESKYKKVLSTDWLNFENDEIRIVLGSVAKKNEWFKRIDHGLFLGNLIFEYIDSLKAKNLGKILTSLSEWIDN